MKQSILQSTSNTISNYQETCCTSREHFHSPQNEKKIVHHSLIISRALHQKLLFVFTRSRSCYLCGIISPENNSTIEYIRRLSSHLKISIVLTKEAEMSPSFISCAPLNFDLLENNKHKEDVLLKYQGWMLYWHCLYVSFQFDDIFLFKEFLFVSQRKLIE